MPKRIDVPKFETEDGRVFDTYREAKDHERMIALTAIMQQRAAYAEISLDDAVQLILDNAEEIVKILGIRCE